MNLHQKLKVIPGLRQGPDDVDPNWVQKGESEKKAKPKIQKYLEKMDDLQYLMYAENKHSLLIVLQGIDTAGKDGVIRHVLTGMNPQGCRVASFKQPTPTELEHDFLWRVHQRAPKKGEVAIFNRSHYEDVLITRVHDLISEKESKRRYHRINNFEKLLKDENSTTVLKFFLHISKDEQLRRFKQRLDDPARRWKISESDYREREYWKSYMKAYAELLSNTSTEHAPWFIIPANHKWARDLAVAEIITHTFEKLGMKLPKASVDIDAIRRKYFSKS